jgi:post-segregation antitoxin (ccd killing protein)
MSIYLPDELHESVKAHDDLNVSAVCQAALETELQRREALAKLDAEMERIVVHVEDRGDVAFTGTVLANEDYGTTVVYLTKRKRIAVYAEDRSGDGALETFDSFDEFAREFDGRPGLVSEVATELGEEYVTELDI